MSDHTPGPWRVHFGSSGEMSVKDECPRVLAVVKCNGITSLEQHANAALVAASPRLLAVARRAAAGCPRNADWASRCPDGACDACEARRAVDQAEGLCDANQDAATPGPA